jgi:hypothetical protein
MALVRWSSYLQEESDKLWEFSAQILYDQIVSLASAEWHIGLSEGHADKVKKLQHDYLIQVDAVIKESLNCEIEQKRKKVQDKFYKNLGASSNERTENLGVAVKKWTSFPNQSFSSKKVFLYAPVGEVFAKLRFVGYVHPIKNKAVSNFYLGFYTDLIIVTHVNVLITSMLNWYSGVGNFCKVKSLAQLLRKSCILTLANKHKKSIYWVYTVYGRDISVSTCTKEIRLKSRASILNHRNKFNLKTDFFSLDFYGMGNAINCFTG